MERKYTENDLRSEKPETRLLYITAEQCTTSRFRELLAVMMRNDSLAYVIIDEAHCVTDWGDFRPDYKRIGELRELTEGVNWAALTATASLEAEDEIVKSLKFRTTYKAFKLPCLRSNIFYDVQFKDTLNVSII